MAEKVFGKVKTSGSFTPDVFNKQVLTKGYRAHWSRAILCSCRFSKETNHSDPSCAVCYGDGWYYVCPDVDTIKELTDTGFVSTTTAMATRVIMTAIAKDVDVFHHLGDLITGTARVTSFSFHRLSYRDRLTFVDGISEWQQVMKLPTTLSFTVGARQEQETYLRYPIIGLLEARSLVNGVSVDHRSAATCGSDGSITFDGSTGLAAGDLITIAYEYHPVLVVMENPLDIRVSPSSFKSATESQLIKPRHLLARPDFFPETATGTPADAPPV